MDTARTEDKRGAEVGLPRDPHRGDPRREVVGVILSDGTVYGVSDSRLEPPRRRWSNGRFSGPGWEIWWERRSWNDPPRSG